MPLTSLHLRYADLEAPGWLPPLTEAGPSGGGKGGEPLPLPRTLASLTLEGCQIRTLPPHVSELSALTSLVLDRNYLTPASLPAGLSRLSRLRVLSLADCPSLVALPPSAAALPALEQLCLLNTGVRALPEGAPALAGLTSLAWGVAEVAPVALDLSSLHRSAPRLRALRLNNLPAEQDGADLAALRGSLAGLTYLRVNSAVLVGSQGQPPLALA